MVAVSSTTPLPVRTLQLTMAGQYKIKFIFGMKASMTVGGEIHFVCGEVETTPVKLITDSSQRCYLH